MRLFEDHAGTLSWLLIAIALRLHSTWSDGQNRQVSPPTGCHAIHASQICCAEGPHSLPKLTAAQTWMLGGRMDLNAATSQELSLLPGIGLRRAKAIVESREREGEFLTVTELERVPGLGPLLRKRLEPLCEVGIP